MIALLRCCLDVLVMFLSVHLFVLLFPQGELDKRDATIKKLEQRAEERESVGQGQDTVIADLRKEVTIYL